MKLFNTMTMQKEEFVPIEAGKVRLPGANDERAPAASPTPAPSPTTSATPQAVRAEAAGE